MDIETQEELVEIYAYNSEGDYYNSTFLDEADVADTDWYTTIEPPPFKEENIQVFDKSAQEWSYVKDHRGKLVYSVKTGEASMVDYLGNLRGGYTFNTPDEIDASKDVWGVAYKKRKV